MLRRLADRVELKAHFPLGEFVRVKRKTNLGNVIGQRKNSQRKSWTVPALLLFARTNSPSGKWALGLTTVSNHHHNTCNYNKTFNTTVIQLYM
jgi:hypothetical protein